MDKRQAVLLIGAVVILAVVMTVAAFMGQQSSRAGLGGEAKRFVAKAGTTRDNARFLRSKRKPTEQASSNTSSGKQQRPGEWGDPEYDITSVTTAPPSELEATPEEAAVRSVMEQLSTEAGVERVLEALREVAPGLDTCDALTYLGKAYGEMTPPKTQQAQEAFDRAAAAAENPEERARVLAAAAEQYLDAGAVDAARLRIETGMAGLQGIGPAQIELNVLLARSHEERQESDEAKALYAAAVDDALQLPATDPAVVDMLRLASTRLAWHYHREGRHDEAEALAKRVRPILERARQPE